MSENNENLKSHYPSSRKIYVETNGSTVNQTKHNLRVPFREIALSPSRNMKDELEENAPVRVYDTSGVWTDPNEKCDVREGLPQLRRDWILQRGDVEEYVGREILPQDNGYLTKGAENIAKIKEQGKLEEFPGLKRAPLKAKAGKCVTHFHDFAFKGARFKPGNSSSFPCSLIFEMFSEPLVK